MTRSQELFNLSRRHLAGGVNSLNRKVEPEIAFVRGKGAHLWDADGNRYLDYHAAFGPYLFGHGDPDIEQAIRRAQDEGWTLTGTGTTPWEAEAAELLTQCVPTLDKVQFTNTGSEATYLALRLARAYTGRDHVVVMQGGYNGWHDEVACNVMTPLDQIGPERHDGEYPFVPMSAGGMQGVCDRVHVVGFNSLEAVEWAFRSYPVAALITEPILQNIGIVKPKSGYLRGLRELCDRYGVVLIFDEVKTGFRHALAGYHSVAGVRPDLATFGKAIANGYPVGAIGGRSEVMALFDEPDAARRVLIAGTYNGHPMPLAAAIAAMRKLRDRGPEIYAHLERLGSKLQAGLEDALAGQGVVARQGSAFAVYFMDHEPISWHDLAANHDMGRDARLRRAMIARGVYWFPLPTKQCSISLAHTEGDIDETLTAFRAALEETR